MPELAVAEPPMIPSTNADTGFDRELGLMLAKVPFTAIGWAAAAWVAANLWAQFAPAESTLPNCGALIVICVGMVLAAVIDGVAFKVPNWLTLSLVVAGWYLGILHSLGVSPETGTGGIGYALLGTLLGFLALFPALAIGGMGQGDVKMTMAFGSWMGAFFGEAASNSVGISGAAALWWSFALGVIIGGIFGLIIMALRRQFSTNVSNFRAIAGDLQALMTDGPGKCNERALSRRKDWVRLPYGVPLCVGFLGYLWYRLFLAI